MKLTVLSVLTRILLFLVSITPFLIISQALLTTNPLIWPDEATFTNLASFFNRHGYIATTLFGTAVPGMNIRTLAYPPAYILTLAFWIRAFGSGIEAVRLLSVCISILTLMSAYFLFRLITRSRWLGYLGVFLLSIDFGFGWASRIGRMEAMIELCIVLSVYLYLLAYRKQSLFLLLISGISAGIAGMSHPIGLTIVGILALAHFVTWKKSHLSLWSFLLLLGPFIIMYILWILTNLNYLNYLIIQIQFQLVDKQNYGPYIFNIISHQPTIYIFIIYIIILYAYFVVAKKRPIEESVVISLGIVAMTIVQIIGKIQWYIVYFQPWIILTTLVVIIETPSRYRISTFIIIFGLIISNILIYRAILQDTPSRHDTYSAFASNIARLIPDNSSILLATIPDPYFDLATNPSLSLYEAPTGPISTDAYERLLSSIDIIVMNYVPTPWLVRYTERNKQFITFVQQPDTGYQTNVVFLVPKNLRHSTKNPPN